MQIRPLAAPPPAAPAPPSAGRLAAFHGLLLLACFLGEQLGLALDLLLRFFRRRRRRRRHRLRRNRSRRLQAVHLLAALDHEGLLTAEARIRIDRDGDAEALLELAPMRALAIEH